MRAATQKTIGGTRYDIKPLPSGKGVRMLARLGRVLGPALDGAARLEGLSLEDGLRLVAGAFGGLAAKLDPAELESICREFATETMVEAEAGSGKMIPLEKVFDDQFAGAYDALLEWFSASLEVNFDPLVRALSGGMSTALSQLQAKAAGDRSAFPGGSRGSSIASPSAASTGTPSTSS